MQNHDSLMKGIVTETVLAVKFDTFKFEIMQRIEDKLADFTTMVTQMLSTKVGNNYSILKIIFYIAW